MIPYSFCYNPSTYYAITELLCILVNSADAWLVLLLMLQVMVIAMVSSIAMHLYIII